MNADFNEKFGAANRTEGIIDGRPYFLSEPYVRAQAAIEKSPQLSESQKELALQILDEIHVQAADNSRLWESKNSPGVSAVVSSINLSQIVRKFGHNDQLDTLQDAALTEDSRRVQYWVLSSSTPVSDTDGGTHSAFDMAISRVFHELPRLVRDIKQRENSTDGKTTGRLKDVEIVLLGSPLVAGGRITDDWVDNVKTNGILNAQAELNAELVTELFLTERNADIVLFGHSYGAMQSLKTAARLPQEVKKCTSVLADAPAPIHGSAGAKLNGVQEILGLVIEGLPSMVQKRDDWIAKLSIAKSYTAQLQRNNIPTEYTDEEKTLINETRLLVVNQIKNGILDFDIEQAEDYAEVKVHIRQGIKDLITMGRTRIQRVLSWTKDTAVKLLDAGIPGLKTSVPVRYGHDFPRFTGNRFNAMINTVKAFGVS